MKMQLGSGKTIDANCGFIGLNEEGEIALGFDDQLTSFEKTREYDESAEATDFWLVTKEEQREIADLMIVRWQKFRDGLT